MSAEPTDRFHNQPETGTLGMAELAVVEAGRSAMANLQKTLDLWLAVGEAIKVLRAKADRDGRRQTFKRLMRQNGFAMENPDKVIDPGLVTHLLDVLAHKADVIRWHEGLSPKQKREWAAPNTIKKHCPIFAKPPVGDGGEKPLTPAEKDRHALAAALEEIEQAHADIADVESAMTVEDDGTPVLDFNTAIKALAQNMAQWPLEDIKGELGGDGTVMDALCRELCRLLPDLDAWYRNDGSEDDDEPEQGLVWTGDEKKGFGARIEDGPVVYTVVPVKLGGSPHFEANRILAYPKDMMDTSVRRLTNGCGKSLPDPSGKHPALKPVPTAAAAKAQCEADYARRQK